jgi:hypothetical protein
MSVINKNISFQRFLELVLSSDLEGVIQNRPILKNAVKHSQYVDYLEPWIAKMGQQVSVRLFEDMTSNPRAFMMNLADDLGIESIFFKNFDFSAKNKTYSVRSQKLHLFKKKFSSVLPDGPVRKALRDIYFDLNTNLSPDKTSADLDSIAMLDQYFTEYNTRLEGLSGLDLSPWTGT